MSDFLLGFSVRVVHELLQRGLLEVAPDGERAVVQFVADHLAASKPGQSLVSRLVDGLVRCPQVEEFFADDEALKALIQDQGLTH